MKLKGMVVFAAACVASAVAAVPAQAADFSFAGTLADPGQVLFFDFAVGASSLVTLRTYSYAGGTNAQGTVIARGGFDPTLSLYNLTTGLRIAQNDDGGSNVPADTNGRRWDTYLQTTLAIGTYRTAVSVFPNFGPETLSGTFPGGTTFDGRTANFAFDVLNVGEATGPGGGAVPEPATWAMMILGFGMIGFGMRYSMRKSNAKFDLKVKRIAAVLEA
jgi:hypothetical protein